LPAFVGAGSFTANTISANATKAGTTAIQNTRVKLFSVSAISPIAASGPMKAPAVSSDCRRPNAAPRTAGGVRSAISASRGAPRMPLPMRSTKRAATIQPNPVASGKTGLVKAASP